MMDTRQVEGQTDEKIRDLYRESALRTDMALFTERLRDNLAGERRPRAAASSRRPGWWSQLRARPRRLALAAVAGVMVLGALGFGVYATVQHFSQKTPILVIGDDSMLGSTAAPSAYDAVLPPGVSAVVGASGSSLWCLSRELGFTALELGAPPVEVVTGTKGDRVAYTTEKSESGDIFVWDAAQTGADPGVTRLAVGDASQRIALLEMSPDGTKLAVARDQRAPAQRGVWDGRLYIVDLTTGSAAEWQWAEGSTPPSGTPAPGFVWSPASDAFYVSFPTPGEDLAGATTYRCDLTSAATASLGELGYVLAVSGTGSVAGLVLDYGPMGFLSSAYPDPSISIWHDGQIESVKPAMQSTFGPLFMSADGESMVLQGDSYDQGIESGVALEVLEHGDAGWISAEAVKPPSLVGNLTLGFSGSNEFYFVAAPALQSNRAWRLGALDPATGDYQIYEELPVEGIWTIRGLWTQPSTTDETPEDTSTTTPATTSTTESTSAPVPVTSTADLPLSEVEGATVFSAGWGSGAGEFGVVRDDAFGLFTQGPGSLWVTPDERLYILDPLNHRVQVVGADGTVEPAIPVDLGYPIDVAAAPDGTVLVLGSDLIQAYSPKGAKLGEYPAHFGDAYPTEFVADETTVYCSHYSGVGKDSADAPIEVTKYVPVYRDGELLDPAAGWETAPYDQPLSQGLSLRVGDRPLGEGAASESIGNIHVYAGEQPAFSSDLTPADYGPVTGIATDDGEVLVSRGRIVSEDPGATLAHALWVFSPIGTPMRRIEVLQPLHSTADSSGGCRSRLSRSGAFFVLTTTSDGLSVVRYDLAVGVHDG
jgi:hypothetical protein